MLKLLPETVLSIHGAYALEHVGDVDFQWLGENVRLFVNSSASILFLRGESPVANDVKITATWGESIYSLEANVPLWLPIVLREHNDGTPQEILLHFSNHLSAAGDCRKLCFQL